MYALSEPQEVFPLVGISTVGIFASTMPYVVQTDAYGVAVDGRSHVLDLLA
jgi:hypothetical protein